jgi:hypothetical protein
VATAPQLVFHCTVSAESLQGPGPPADPTLSLALTGHQLTLLFSSIRTTAESLLWTTALRLSTHSPNIAWDGTPKKTPTVASAHCCVFSHYQVMSTPQAYSVHVTLCYRAKLMRQMMHESVCKWILIRQISNPHVVEPEDSRQLTVNWTCWLIGNSRLVFRRCSVRISAKTPAILTEVSRGFPQSFRTNCGIVPRLGHGHDVFLPNTFQFVIHHPVIRRYITGSVVTRPMKPTLIIKLASRHDILSKCHKLMFYR